MRCFQGRLFTVDGMVEDEAPLKKEIYEQIRYYATTSVARRIEHIVQAIKLACASEPPEIQTDRIHVRNGTYFADGHFTPEKEYCTNLLYTDYDSNYSHIDTDGITDAIVAARALSPDIIVAALHWGSEDVSDISDTQEKIAMYAIYFL